MICRPYVIICMWYINIMLCVYRIYIYVNTFETRSFKVIVGMMGIVLTIVNNSHIFYEKI